MHDPAPRPDRRELHCLPCRSASPGQIGTNSTASTLKRLSHAQVAPRVPAIEDAWPLRLGQIGANCTVCPEGAHCHGRSLPPVTKAGYWTDWESEDKAFWEDAISPQFYKCDSRNVREVCLGYPLLDSQERYEICTFKRNYGVCNDWPLTNYSVPPDPRRSACVFVDCAVYSSARSVCVK